MRIHILNLRVVLNLPVISLAVLMLIWAWQYYYRTLNGTDEGVESVLFMRPVFYGILACFPFVIWSAIRINRRISETQNTHQKADSQDPGLLDRRRMMFVLILALYVIAIHFLGFVIPSVLFIATSFYSLGSRKIWVLAVVPLGLVGFLSFVFSALLRIPIDLWP